MATMDDIPITGDHIKLGQLLKLAGVIESGAHAKLLLADLPVLVNDEAETRRGRRLVKGDRVQVGDMDLRVV
ncbi:RNA-binding S4 domain-containing protein [soil metagenome]